MNSCKNTHNMSLFFQDMFTNCFILFLRKNRDLGGNPHRLRKNVQNCAQTVTRAQNWTGDHEESMLHQYAHHSRYLVKEEDIYTKNAYTLLRY